MVIRLITLLAGSGIMQEYMETLEAFFSLILGIGILYAIIMFALGGLCRGLPRICRVRESDRPAKLSRLNPLTTASTLIAFGVIGLVMTAVFDIGLVWPLLLSGLGAGIIRQVTYSLVTRGFFQTHGSAEERSPELPGSRVEVKTTIVPGGIGEILFVADDASLIYPARAIDPESRISKGALAVVVSIGEDGIVRVKLIE